MAGMEEQYSSTSMKAELRCIGLSLRQKGIIIQVQAIQTVKILKVLLTFTKKIGDFNINANAGSDFFSSILKSILQNC